MYQQGFTIVELMVTLAIAAIIIAIAAPSFQAVIYNNRVTAAVNDFTASIALAKTEAVKRNTNAQIYPTNGGSDWSEGYKIGIDLDGNNLFTDTVDGVAETTLKIIDAPPLGVIVESDEIKFEYNSFGGITNSGTDIEITFDAYEIEDPSVPIDYVCWRTIQFSASGTNTIDKQSQPCN